ncbi:unnamed protein product, partial [Closterium sp. NIES-64]
TPRRWWWGGRILVGAPKYARGSPPLSILATFLCSSGMTRRSTMWWAWIQIASCSATLEKLSLPSVCSLRPQIK